MDPVAISALCLDEIQTWNSQEEAADLMVPLIGNLYRRKNIVTTIFGKGLVHQNSIDIIKLHSYVCKHVGKEMMPTDTLPVLQVITELDSLGATRLDLGRTYLLVCGGANTKAPTKDDVARVLKQLIIQTSPRALALTKPRDIVLYGFGRIGRLLARLLIEKSGSGAKLMLRAIVVRKGSKEDLKKRASLLRRDSVHGSFQGTISFNEEANAFIANGNVIQVIYSDGPDKCDYTSYGIEDAVVIDNTGIWRDAESLGRHLRSPGVSKVVLTAPPKGNSVPTIVAGVNDHVINSENKIYSCASCTTNAIAPLLFALDNKYGIDEGHIETVHSFTNDQNLIDNYHMKERRGRSAVMNMVITETGAAAAVEIVMPTMKNKLTANSIRVPTPNVSLAIMTLHLNPEKAGAFTAADINAYAAKLSLNSPLQHQIDFINSNEAASSDFVGYRAAGIVDGQATIVRGNKVILYVWYDNEFGYSCQVMRVVQKICGISLPKFPDQSHVDLIDSVLN
ncbi:glyceraldehyde-3-phosphate dehydrogenase, type I [Aphanomyces invadans]|uniref:Glyceraldehyde-3-phosphate dehydrogenase, type I n=1 Tax=Aphanomyces invadans TaxID=157072 RepID=A0A024URZ0_9STRA|nr:glyceraldehyde-3-phosphate dehydrogenase, type I [Aphanomyces invadans]ETW09069.1 glyceraldehyde-3-phosphate dehydrogenase, type I [Aphanomyces invadans]|eukprot:XP_008862874.1 glyceraldehyde-3-phosphate dehydrogenase, type I [Aphanomyces invadans]